MLISALLVLCERVITNYQIETKMLHLIFSTSVFLLVGILLFAVIARSLPHDENIELNQQWKIAILFAINAFGLLLLAIFVIGFAVFAQRGSGSNELSIMDLVILLIQAVLSASCLGIYLAIFIMVMVYWKFRISPWSSHDLQTGAFLFDKLIKPLRRITGRFRRVG
jgi:hypothetical protein